MSSGKNAYSEMPVVQPVFHYESVQFIHQPIVVAVDVSGSMDVTEDGQMKTNLKLAEDMVNQIGQDPELKEEYKSTADLCVMTFADYVTTVQDWTPLSQYHGGITLTKMGVTAFHDVVKQALNAVHVMKRSYVGKGIQCKRPQIFIITDGYSTDPKYNSGVVAEAKQLCEKYVDTNKVALHVILLPGGATTDSKQLSPNVKHYKVDDCAYGLPAIKDFINASIVAVSSSNPGTDAQVPLPDPIKTTQSVQKGSDGTRYVSEDVETWN